MTQQATADIVTTKEKQKWESWAQKNTDFFKSSLAEDFVGVDSSGLTIKKLEIVEYVVEQNVNDYSINEVNVVALSENIALVTYRATQHYTYKGQEGASNVVVSSIWINRSGEWLNILHQETPVQHQ